MKNAYIQFNATREESELIGLIASRFIALCDAHQYPHDRFQTVLMDVEACHSNGMPLDLAGLLEARDSDLLHDVLGIRRHINRETGEIENCFVPRYALRELDTPEGLRLLGEIKALCLNSWCICTDGSVTTIAHLRETLVALKLPVEARDEGHRFNLHTNS